MAFPQFSSLSVQEYNGTNRYNSLQLQAQKRFSKTLSFTGTYTWTRLRERVNYLNPSDTELENRISPDERPHRYTILAVYQLPVGRGKSFGSDMNRALDAFIGGWQLNGTYEWQKGEPFEFTNPLYFAGDVTQLKSRVGQKDDQGRTYGKLSVCPGFQKRPMDGTWANQQFAHALAKDLMMKSGQISGALRLTQNIC
jgi:hypothetical protein